MINIGIIGYKNHAGKIIKILRKNYKIKYIYHPKKNLYLKNFTNNLENFLKLDCIFIICPSKSHFSYLNFFNKNKFKGYIFCEKPPVTKKEDLKKISKFKNNKTYFNFNLRHSDLIKYMNYNKVLGDLISLNIIDSKPLIFKKEISKNWRMYFKDTLITNNLIHYLDLIIYKFSAKIKDMNIVSNKINKKLKIIDNILVSFKIRKKIFNINLSYSNGLEKLYLFYFKNGKIEITDNYIKAFYPNNKFNKKGNFLKPKLKKTHKIEKVFENSNKKSINYFMKIVKNKISIPKNENKIALQSNKIILDLSKRI